MRMFFVSTVVIWTLTMAVSNSFQAAITAAKSHQSVIVMLQRQNQELRAQLEELHRQHGILTHDAKDEHHVTWPSLAASLNTAHLEGQQGVEFVRHINNPRARREEVQSRPHISLNKHKQQHFTQTHQWHPRVAELREMVYRRDHESRTIQELLRNNTVTIRLRDGLDKESEYLQRLTNGQDAECVIFGSMNVSQFSLNAMWRIEQCDEQGNTQTFLEQKSKVFIKLRNIGVSKRNDNYLQLTERKSDRCRITDTRMDAQGAAMQEDLRNVFLPRSSNEHWKVEALEDDQNAHNGRRSHIESNISAD